MSSKPPWMAIAYGEQGVEEPESAKYFTYTNYEGDDTGRAAYCAAFMCYCYEKAGFRSPRSAAAISYLDWGRKVPEGTLGATAIFEWVDEDGYVTGHHVSFYDGDGQFFGGNQTKAHEVCRESCSFDCVIAWRMPPDWKG